MGDGFDHRVDHIDRHIFIRILIRSHSAAAKPREAKMLPRGGLAVDFAGRNVIAHAVNLVVGPPQLAGHRVEVMPDRVAHPVGIHLALGAVTVHADDAADAHLVIQRQFFPRGDIKRLAEGDINLVIGSHLDHPGGVVVTLLLDRYQFALRHHRHGHHIRAFVKKFGRRIHQHPVALGDIQKPVFGERQAVGDVHFKRWREVLDLIGHPVAVAVHHRPNLFLFGADEQHRALRRERHMAGVGHQRIQRNLKPLGQRDAPQNSANRFRRRAILRDDSVLGGAGNLERAQFFQIGLRH